MILLNPHGSDETPSYDIKKFIFSLLLNPHGSDETNWIPRNATVKKIFLTHTVQMKLP